MLVIHHVHMSLARSTTILQQQHSLTTDVVYCELSNHEHNEWLLYTPNTVVMAYTPSLPGVGVVELTIVSTAEGKGILLMVHSCLTASTFRNLHMWQFSGNPPIRLITWI